MSPSSRSVSDTELAVLKVLWDVGEAAVREIRERLEAEGFEWAYTTVQTLLGRLEQKGYVESERDGRAFLFRATVTREELLSLELGDLAERVCEGAALPLVLSLVQGRRFSKSEIARFRELVDSLEDETAERGSKRSKRSKRRS